LADYSSTELQSMCGYRKLSEEENNGGKPFPYNKADFQNLPSEIDWRIAGAVTAVKGIVIIINKFFKLLFVLYLYNLDY